MFIAGSPGHSRGLNRVSPQDCSTLLGSVHELLIAHAFIRYGCFSRRHYDKLGTYFKYFGSITPVMCIYYVPAPKTLRIQ